jgi:hypothetical protein
MADLIDPEKLKSVAQLATELGYSPNYFANLAAQEKFKAWRIGNTWATTKEIVQEYIRTALPPGPRAKSSANTGSSQTRHRKNKKKT